MTSDPVTSDSVARTSQHLGPRRLIARRRRTALTLLEALAIIALCLVTATVILNDPVAPVNARILLACSLGLSVAINVVLAACCVIQLRRPPYLELDERGLTVCHPPFATLRDEWASIGPVVVWRFLGSPLVSFESPSFAAEHRWSARLNRALGAHGAVLRSGSGGLKAKELAELLDAYRAAYGRSQKISAR